MNNDTLMAANKHRFGRLGPVINGAFILMLAAIIGVALAAHHNNGVLDYADREVADTNRRITMLNLVEALLYRAESDQRGFVITENEVYAQSYNENVEQLRHTLAQLKAQHRYDSERLAALREFEQRVQDKVDYTLHIMNLIREKKRTEAVALLVTGQGRGLTEKSRGILGQIITLEERTLKQNQQEVDAATHMLESILLGGVILAALLTGLCIWFINRVVAARIRGELGVFSSSSSEISAAVSEHERVVGQQAAAVAQTTSTMEELTVSASQTSQQAEAASSSAREAQALIDAGLQMVIDRCPAIEIPRLRDAGLLPSRSLQF